MTITTDTRIVLLGGTSGIGLATARAAAAAGATVFIGSRNASSVERALAELPPTVTGAVVDASSSEDVGRFFDGIGEFDHFAYTAADNLRSVTIQDFTVEQGLSFLGLRLVHALDAVRLAVPHLRAGGSITLTSGTAAFKGGAGWVLGSAASGATISAAKSLAVELAPLRVNAVAPGVVRSPLWSQLSDADREAMYQATDASLPVGRVAEPEDVAKAFLALMDQDYVTGTVSVVDGGTLVA
ncbi:SDR family oxidoreductase [Plantibacter sp. YIM 135347]|uniref:SDR family oxidoreductase n=1 Tax=Plantibacter sp. YIM 135347 TaxID=3423919 RepID=UPI003D34D703